MARKSSFSGVIVVLICILLIFYYTFLFRKALRESHDSRRAQEHVLLNSQN